MYIDVVAARYNVSASIHPEDYIFQHLYDHPKWSHKNEAIEMYFYDGMRSASKFAALCNEFLPRFRSPQILEFASGYGCVSRHWKTIIPNAQVVSCDIHESAVEFLRDKLNVPALLSTDKPEELTLQKFDVVFALSFFSHMPRVTWGRWLEALFWHVKQGGYLMFTTHGHHSIRLQNIPAKLSYDGFWFNPASEQKDLSPTEYGTTVTTSKFCFAEIEDRLSIREAIFSPAYWWRHQDLYIIGK